ncbi:GNAT family N-acetyltransferase [uncultured Ruegeria sp.]|uniref:GNAT family N-acetyltransferase n=1 Tax=uncultured Ruegeria sp. TaxID=259304 RepID=UPI002639D5E1|nr:GNAT family N-acetyltransferase [uncultured Ruegeria sp.]
MPRIDLIYDFTQIDTDRLCSAIRNEYWGQNLSENQIYESFRHSSSVCAVIAGQAVGFTRAVSDRVTCAYIKDFLVYPEYRGQGIGKHLMRGLLEHPELVNVTSWYLGTKDAHSFYEPFGFKTAPDGIYMYLHLACPE